MTPAARGARTARQQLTAQLVIRRRLATQMLLSPRVSQASDVVHALGAVQAQDYAGAKWALGLRTSGVVDADVERELHEGTILRTHVLRPTWHFVTPQDIRWMLALSAPRINAAMAWYDRRLELDASVFRRSNDAIAEALENGHQLTRAELSAVLVRAGVRITSGQRLGHLLMRAELDAVVTSGARREKQFTYALFDERVPPSKPLERDEALFALVIRYFTTRGPATASDFAWWSGLTIADAKRGLAMAGRRLTHGSVNGRDVWFVDSELPSARSLAHLLPNYDEFVIAYKDRSLHVQRAGNARAIMGSDASLSHVVFVNGQLVGKWRRAVERDHLVVQLQFLTTISDQELGRIAKAARRLGNFVGLPVRLVNATTGAVVK